MNSALKSGVRPAPRTHPRERRTGADGAYDLLRQQILSLEIAPGADLDESELVDRCGVSRTPLREALIRLAADRLVVQTPNRGYVVVQLLLADFPQFVEALAITQGAVSALAAARRTDADLERIRIEARHFAKTVKRGDQMEIVAQNCVLRMKIAEASGNEYFTASYRQLMDECVRLAHTFFARDKQPDRCTQDHDSVIDTIARQDATAAEQSGRQKATEFQSHEWLDHHDSLIDAIARQDASAAEQIGRQQAAGFQRRILAYLQDVGVSSISKLADHEVLAPLPQSTKAA